MTPSLADVIAAAKALPSRDKQQLLEVLVEELSTNGSLESKSAGFWASKPLYVAETARLPEVTDIRQLASDFWPEGESVDEFNAYVDADRNADRASHSP